MERKYKFNYNEGNYIVGFVSVTDNNYDYEGQMADFPEACEGWTKFENGTFVIDEDKKAEIIAEREAEAEEAEKEANWMPSQVLWTALMTDTLLEEE